MENKKEILRNTIIIICLVFTILIITNILVVKKENKIDSLRNEISFLTDHFLSEQFRGPLNISELYDFGINTGAIRDKSLLVEHKKYLTISKNEIIYNSSKNNRNDIIDTLSKWDLLTCRPIRLIRYEVPFINKSLQFYNKSIVFRGPNRIIDDTLQKVIRKKFIQETKNIIQFKKEKTEIIKFYLHINNSNNVSIAYNDSAIEKEILVKLVNNAFKDGFNVSQFNVDSCFIPMTIPKNFEIPQ